MALDAYMFPYKTHIKRSEVTSMYRSKQWSWRRCPYLDVLMAMNVLPEHLVQFVGSHAAAVICER